MPKPKTSESSKPAPLKAKPEEPKPEEPKPPAAVDELDFARLIGKVRPIANTPRVAQGPPTADGPTPVNAAPPKNRLKVVWRDEYVRGTADGVSGQVVDRLAKGSPAPSRQLDLHGLRAAEARAFLTQAVRDARRDGVACLLVICGRGKHSEAGAVLREVAVEHSSDALSDQVLAFCTAPSRWGGSGALLVRLRPRR